MSTNSKFETARLDGRSDCDSDVDDAAIVSTILGSDCETHDVNDDLREYIPEELPVLLNQRGRLRRRCLGHAVVAERRQDAQRRRSVATVATVELNHGAVRLDTPQQLRAPARRASRAWEGHVQQ